MGVGGATLTAECRVGGKATLVLKKNPRGGGGSAISDLETVAYLEWKESKKTLGVVASFYCAGKRRGEEDSGTVICLRDKNLR